MKWEYKHLIWGEVFHDRSSCNCTPEERIEKINALGEEGWELVSVTFSDDGNPTDYIFKRPK